MVHIIYKLFLLVGLGKKLGQTFETANYNEQKRKTVIKTRKIKVKKAPIFGKTDATACNTRTSNGLISSFCM